MEIYKTPFVSLIKDVKVQLRIPIYQRKYDWDKRNCEELLEDIIDVGQKDSSRQQHYLGSIIYKPLRNSPTIGVVNEFFLIDGQQRLTTLMLILWALIHYAEETMDSETYQKADFTREKLEKYLFNSNQNPRHKLQLIGDDERAYNALMNDQELPSDIDNSRIYSNYKAILTALKKSNVHPEVVLRGIEKLEIANISLEKGENPQLIFETVNSTGKSLSTVDKVRNYLLMNAGEELQQDLYTSHWAPMEQRLEQRLEDFFHHFTILISEERIRKSNDKGKQDIYYEVFKDHFLDIDSDGIKKVVEQMAKYSFLYKRWVDSNALSTGIDLMLYRIKETDNNQCLPVVLKILMNKQSGIMNEQETEEALLLLESYIIRRELVGLSTNSMGDAFIKILKAADSLDNIKHCLDSGLTTKQCFPKDDDLKIKLETHPLYMKSSRCLYILNCIERYLNKEYQPSDTISIEHIMPQTIQSSEELYARTDYTDEEKKNRDWAKDLGDRWRDIHTKYCHTLGNLTLTGYNTELSNYRFSVKRQMKRKENGHIYGYDNSVIYLSHSLAGLPHWGEKEILERCNTLYGYIHSIWPYPTIATKEEEISNLESAYEDEEARKEVVELLFRSPDIKEIKKNRVYAKSDESVGYTLQASKMYQKGSGEQYWFRYRENSLKSIQSCREKNCIFICRSNTLDILQIPASKLEEWKDRIGATKDSDGNISHYHIKFRKDINGKIFLLFVGKSNRIDVTNFRITI